MSLYCNMWEGKNISNIPFRTHTCAGLDSCNHWALQTCNTEMRRHREGLFILSQNVTVAGSNLSKHLNLFLSSVADR